MIAWIRDIFRRETDCEANGHWWDTPAEIEAVEHVGATVCNQQRSYVVTFRLRKCLRCPTQDVLRVGEPVYQGWD